MGSENVVTDLFGDAVTLPSGRRGRPSHRWSKSAADRVIIGLAMGYKTREIAHGLGISEPTLRKYYFSELKRAQMQRTRYELWRAETLAKQAASGNVGAMKELDRMFQRRDTVLAEESRGQDDHHGKPPAMGKKEISAKLALSADADLMAEIEAEAMGVARH